MILGVNGFIICHHIHVILFPVFNMQLSYHPNVTAIPKNGSLAETCRIVNKHLMEAHFVGFTTPLYWWTQQQRVIKSLTVSF